MKHLFISLLVLLFASQSTFSQDLLAGVTTNGGAEGGGTAFTIKTNGTSFSAIKAFANWGSTPSGTLTRGADGNLYGVAYEGGIYGTGTIFRVTPAGIVTVLKNLSLAVDGGYPKGGLVLASDGNFYGTCTAGMPNNGGGIFKITPGGVYTIVRSLSVNADGGKPSGRLLQAADGNFYGMNASGGANSYGTIFKLTTSGAYSVLRSFKYDTDGGTPYGSLIQAKDGNLYGMSYWGGSKGYGTIFRITTAGIFTVLRHLDNTNDGSYPYGDLLEAKDGLLYAMISKGGTNGNGTIIKISTAGVFTRIKVLSGSAEGGNPSGSLIQGADGNFYGMTTNISGGFYGSIIKMTTAGAVTVMKKLTLATDGGTPTGTLMQYPDGYLYGLTTVGGANFSGTVFKISTANVYSVVAGFNGATQGRAPQENAALGKDSAYYGMTNLGGLYNFGTIYKICGGTTTVLKHFNKSTDGGYPFGSLILATDGNLYGMTSAGGTNGGGTIFKITAAGVYTVLRHLKASTDGSTPLGSLLHAKDGFLYGMASLGGTSNAGTIFKISTGGVFTLLRSLVSSTDGANPEGGLLQASDLNLYGFTKNKFFKLTTTGTFAVLATLASSSQGSTPVATPVQGTDGNFYCTTSDGGFSGGGTILKITPAGAITVLRQFTTATDGGSPKGALMLASDGNFYGMNALGGTNKAGTIFRISTTGSFAVVRHFNLLADGGAPNGGLILAPKNNLAAIPQSNIGALQNTGKAVLLAGTGSSSLAYTITAQPKNGKLTGSGKNWTYTANANYSGKDSFAFAVNVGCLYSAPATVSFNVALKKTTFANGLAQTDEQKKIQGRSSLYPNPVSSFCIITVPELFESVSTGVYDMKGSLVLANRHRVSGAGQVELDASSLKTGQYLVRVVTDKGAWSYKFIRN